jgi:hypothetical protein
MYADCCFNSNSLGISIMDSTDIEKDLDASSVAECGTAHQPPPRPHPSTSTQAESFRPPPRIRTTCHLNV